MLVTFSLLGKYGRLGNCMFQIAATVAYAIRTGRACKFPDWYGYQYFPNLQPYFTNLSLPAYHHPYFHYVQIPSLPEMPQVDLIGFFQSEKYFAESRKEIHDLFTIAPSIQVGFRETTSCSIHVRRGDYCDGTGYHLLGMDYYQEAVRVLFGDKWNDVFYVICSDDLDWCKQNFKFKKQVFGSNSEIYDLSLMSQCNHNIIANSSFSWWAAELNRHSCKKVVAPQKWFLKDEYDTKDLYSEGWIII
jgi:hypothetical protein